jgi:hypothetical protein
MLRIINQNVWTLHNVKVARRIRVLIKLVRVLNELLRNVTVEEAIYYLPPTEIF